MKAQYPANKLTKEKIAKGVNIAKRQAEEIAKKQAESKAEAKN